MAGALRELLEAENGGNKTPLVFNLPAISPFVFVVPNILFPALNSTTFVGMCGLSLIHRLFTEPFSGYGSIEPVLVRV